MKNGIFLGLAALFFFGCKCEEVFTVDLTQPVNLFRIVSASYDNAYYFTFNKPFNPKSFVRDVSVRVGPDQLFSGYINFGYDSLFMMIDECEIINKNGLPLDSVQIIIDGIKTADGQVLDGNYDYSDGGAFSKLLYVQNPNPDCGAYLITVSDPLPGTTGSKSYSIDTFGHVEFPLYFTGVMDTTSFKIGQNMTFKSNGNSLAGSLRWNYDLAACMFTTDLTFAQICPNPPCSVFLTIKPPARSGFLLPLDGNGNNQEDGAGNDDYEVHYWLK